MTRRETVFLLALIILVVGFVTVVGEFRRRSFAARDAWRGIPEDAGDSYVLNPDGSPALDPYGRKKPAGTLEVTWMGPPDVQGMSEDTWIKRKLEERFNLRIRPVILDPNQYDRKRPLMFCGGRIPDLCWINDPANLRKDAENGFLVEVSYKTLARHAPRLVSELNRIAPYGWAYAMHRGRLFGLPTVNPAGRRPRPGIWRADWLRQVGLVRRDAEGRQVVDEHGRPAPGAPETLEEFEEALRRFRNMDPDGNGKVDTYGMSGDISEWWWTTFSEIFGAHGVMPFDWQYDPSTGELTWGGITDAALQTIKLLRRWREEDLIDPDFLTDSWRGDQLLGKFRNGRIGYINYAAVWWRVDPKARHALPHEMRQIDPDAEILIAVPPSGSTGDPAYDIMTGRRLPPGHPCRGVRTWGGAGNILCFGRHTADRPAKAVRLLGLLNTLAEETDAAFEAEDPVSLFPTDPGAPIFGYEVRRGRRLTHWEFIDLSRPLNGSDLGAIPPYDGTLRQRREGLLNPSYMLFELKPEHELRVFDVRRREYVETCERPEWALSDVFGKPDVLPSAPGCLEGLRKYQLLQYSLMIRSRDQGGVPEAEIDAAFRRFIEGWKRYGGGVLLEEARSMHLQLREFYKRHGIDAGRQGGSA